MDKSEIKRLHGIFSVAIIFISMISFLILFNEGFCLFLLPLSVLVMLYFCWFQIVYKYNRDNLKLFVVEAILFLPLSFAVFVSIRELIIRAVLAAFVWTIPIFMIEKIIKERLS